MDLKTDIEKLKRIAVYAESLVEDLKQYVFDNGIDEVSGTAMDDLSAENFTKLIGKKLEAVNINGDENVLSDIVTIYDKAIKSIEEELNKNKELEDGHADKFNDATIESFNKVKKVLENSKGKSAGPLKEILDELEEENEKGKIVEEYRDSKIEEIEAEERSINHEIDKNKNGLLDFEFATKNERDAYDKIVILESEYNALQKEIQRIDTELSKPDLSDSDKAELESSKAEKQKTLIKILKDINNMTDKDEDYKQGENESDKDYLSRIQTKTPDLTKYVTDATGKKEEELKNKLEKLKDKKIRIYNEKTKKFEEKAVKDYIDKDEPEQLASLTAKISQDKTMNREALKGERERIDKLNARKYNYINNTNDQSYSQQLPVPVPEKEMGFFDKFKKRQKFYREHEGKGKFKSFFNSFFKKRDAEVFEEEQKRTKAPSEFRKSILVKAEQLMKSGEGKDRAKAAAKTEIFNNMEKDDPFIK